MIRGAWKILLFDYQIGRIILEEEEDLKNSLTDVCSKLLKDRDVDSRVANEKKHLGKRVDLKVDTPTSPLLVELKLFRDTADWKESSTMEHTVESDLKFAEGKENVYVGIIDVIPSTSRQPLSFNLQWNEVEINEEVFQERYAGIAPRTSPPRERIQKSTLVNGLEI